MNMMTEITVIRDPFFFCSARKWIVTLHNCYYKKKKQTTPPPPNNQNNTHTVYVKDKGVHSINLYTISCFPNIELMGKKW